MIFQTSSFLRSCKQTTCHDINSDYFNENLMVSILYLVNYYVIKLPRVAPKEGVTIR